MRSKVSDREIEEFAQWFRKRYILKKRVCALHCFIITFCGTSAVLYSMFVFHNALINRLRYMTFWGAIFTSVISLITGIVCLVEASKETEVTYTQVYFIRLSAATTELVIFNVVMFGLTPLVPDKPDVSSYPGIMMHIVVPLMTVTTFLLNDVPFRKPRPAEPLKGLLLLGAYAGLMAVLFGSGILPSEMAPYSFLDFEKNSALFKIMCLAGIIIVGYGVAWLLMRLNMKLSWIWFYDIRRRRRKG